MDDNIVWKDGFGSLYPTTMYQDFSPLPIEEKIPQDKLQAMMRHVCTGETLHNLGHMDKEIIGHMGTSTIPAKTTVAESITTIIHPKTCIKRNKHKKRRPKTHRGRF